MKPLNVLYVLPVKGGGGGAHSVAQEVDDLIRFGVDASIAVNQASFTSFATNYVDLQNARNAIVSFTDVASLAALMKGKSIVVCTIFTSVELVNAALALMENDCKPRIAYYVQDYEPFFCRPGDELYQQALDSYSTIPNAMLFAKTNWIRDIVTRNHDVDVKKVSPSLDTRLYFPSIKHFDGPVQVTAMVRPSTPRRAPRRTMKVLKEIAEKYRDSVHINIFGCSHLDLQNQNLASDFSFTNHGVLTRRQVASLMRETHIFLDLSDYQAFGRTGLEAMACGCASILPIFGGTDEYAVHGTNALLVDTRSVSNIVSHFDQYMAMPAQEKQRLSQAAVHTSHNFSIGKAAYSKLEIFNELVAA